MGATGQGAGVRRAPGVACVAPAAFGRAWIGIALLFATATVLLRLLAGPQTIDDAYISFVYARHIADGQGFVFNPGDHVLGTTTPLYTLLLALLYKITAISLPSLSVGVAALADGISFMLVHSLARYAGVSRIMALLAAITASSTPLSLFFARSGMETSVITCLTLLALWLFVSENEAGWGIACGVAVLVRPDAALLTGTLLLSQCWYRHAVPRRALAAILAIPVPWLIWSTWYFGQPIPQSVLAKSRMLYATTIYDSARTVGGDAASLLFGQASSPWGVAVFVVSWVIAWVEVGRLASVYHAILVFEALFASSYAVSGAHAVGVEHWYLVPLIPLYSLTLWIAIGAICRHVRPALRTVAVIAAGTAIALAQSSGLSVATHGRFAVLPAAISAPEREQAYWQACQALNPLSSKRTIVAAPEVGTMGYYCHATILDTAGLITRGVSRYYPVPADQLVPGVGYAVPRQLIADTKPAYLVAFPAVIGRSVLRDPAFGHAYARLPIDAGGLMLFKRR